MALVGSTDKSLPFGGLLTLVFEDHGIDLLGEDTTSLKEPFNSASASRIGKKNQKPEHEPQVANMEDSDDAPEPREVHMTDVGGQTQGEQQPHDGRFQPSLEDLYHRQYELEQQFRHFRSDNQATLVGIQSSLGDLHGKMDQVLHYFQNYPPFLHHRNNHVMDAFNPLFTICITSLENSGRIISLVLVIFMGKWIKCCATFSIILLHLNLSPF
ncbi:uncharacterized protein LOC131326251 [Rhododendron vialii]|uniref:uncharacterized protein LOC131326251 n=1 Tax=Rhododendron vialii TaxID=182163 RepID=UPI00265E8931|nr:uncharacterized protein LOC131326251 [Rhododendron vialii]